MIDAITLGNIQRSYDERIKTFVHRTPVLRCLSMDIAASRCCKKRKHDDTNDHGVYGAGNDIPVVSLFLKAEHLQKIGAFKIRGAMNAVGLSTANVITTHSSGNHAQAVAMACQLLKKRAIIVMPEGSPASKVNAVRDTYQAEVRFCTPNQAAREAACEAVMEECRRNGIDAELVHPYDDVRVSCGQGTVALELLEQVEGEQLDAVVISVGGGGLLAGCSTVIKRLSPTTLVIAAEPAQANDCFRSFYREDGTLRPKAERIRALNATPPKTIADSLKTNLGLNTAPVIFNLVDDVFQVSEDQIRAGMRITLERAKQVIEPGAAVAVAVATMPELYSKYPSIRRVGVVLCGGNLDLETIPTLI